MRRLISPIAFLSLALVSCTTISVSDNAISKRWVGRSAGEFFAKYNPPLDDVSAGANTIYSWRGGYKRIRVEGGRSVSVSCSARITVSESYTIRDITIVSDRRGANGPSYCEELLAAG
jgi:hypothetical protein